MIGYITDNSYLDGPTFRGVRWHLLTDFSALYVLDLGGSTKKARSTPQSYKNENVFDITQGVAVLTAFRGAGTTKPTVSSGTLTGDRSEKYNCLLTFSLEDRLWRSCVPASPFYLLHIQTASQSPEYGAFLPVNECLRLNSVGVQTSRDHIAIAFTRDELIGRIKDFSNPKFSDHEIRKRFFSGKRVSSYPPGDTRGWKLSEAREFFAAEEDLERDTVTICYRPMDFRYVYNALALVDWPRPQVSGQMRAGNNVGICVLRRTENTRRYDYFGVSRHTISNHQVSLKDGTYLCPLYVYPESAKKGLLAVQESNARTGRTANLDRQFIKQLAAVVELRLISDGRGDLRETLGPEDILAWIYAVFHSPGYRQRYEAQLRLDFPRVPLPGDGALFCDLVKAGHEMIALHLLECPKLGKPITIYAGPRNPQVGRVGWSNGSVWLDAGKTSAREGHRAAKPGTLGFKGVPEQVWDFHIGGYQVCHKWLKDRKGRTLSDEDIAHYQKIVVALNETIRIMAEIDEVIEAHGGWPDAFQTESEADSASEATAKVVPFQPPTVQPAPEDRYVTCVPLVPLRAAAGGFSDPQHIEDDDFEWVAVKSRHRLRKGMFVAQVVGKSMEPAIRDGAWCLFRAPVEGTRQGKTVLVQLRDATDPETGQRYTVKRYNSEKAEEGDSWRHVKITLDPVNPDFEPIVLTGADEGGLQVVAELIEVLERKAFPAETNSR